MATLDEGLRERKKRQTRDHLHRAALDLVEEKGFAAVTTDEIAARAGVSARTFFNYFPSKDAAVLGWRPDDLEDVPALLAERPAGEQPLASLRAVILILLSPATFDPRLRAQRRRVLLHEPSLAPAFVGGNLRVENALTAAIEHQLDLAPGSDLEVRVMVATALAAVRACLEHHQAGAAGDVEESIDRAFEMLARGFS